MNNLDKKQVAKTPLEDWIDNYTVIHMLHISARTLQTLRTNNTLPYSRINTWHASLKTSSSPAWTICLSCGSSMPPLRRRSTVCRRRPALP